MRPIVNPYRGLLDKLPQLATRQGYQLNMLAGIVSADRTRFGGNVGGILLRNWSLIFSSEVSFGGRRGQKMYEDFRHRKTKYGTQMSWVGVETASSNNFQAPFACQLYSAKNVWKLRL